jgi:nicotinate-nucleotide--dimethylbenzimidazole phosphoribosyltransferase
LNALGIEPLIGLGIARGEGAGAALSIPLIDAAARVLREMV